MAITTSMKIKDVTNDIIIDGELNPAIFILNTNISELDGYGDKIYVIVDESEDSKVQIVSAKYKRMVEFGVDLNRYGPFSGMSRDILALGRFYNRRQGKCYGIILCGVIEEIGVLYIGETFKSVRMGEIIDSSYVRIESGNTLKEKTKNFSKIHIEKLMFLGTILLLGVYIYIFIYMLLSK